MIARPWHTPFEYPAVVASRSRRPLTFGQTPNTSRGSLEFQTRAPGEASSRGVTLPACQLRPRASCFRAASGTAAPPSRHANDGRGWRHAPPSTCARATPHRNPNLPPTEFPAYIFLSHRILRVRGSKAPSLDGPLHASKAPHCLKQRSRSLLG